MDKTKFITRTFTNTTVKYNRFRLNPDTMEVENIGASSTTIKGKRNEDYIKPVIQKNHPGEVLKITDVSYDRKTYKLATSKFLELAEEVTEADTGNTEEVSET